MLKIHIFEVVETHQRANFSKNCKFLGSDRKIFEPNIENDERQPISDQSL